MAIKERPILFSAPMVRAILEGRKTQTRRVVKDVPDWIKDFGYTFFTPDNHISGRGNYEDQGPAEKFFKLKYGKPSDHLWVRETVKLIGHDISYYNSHVGFRYSDEKIATCKIPSRLESEIGAPPKWVYRLGKVPYGCIKEMSRITLEITGIRVERLQSISEYDANNEGVPALPSMDQSSRDGFKVLWDEINGDKHPWDKNPWVWVIDFKRVK